MKLGKGFKIPGDPNLGRLLLDGYARHTQEPSCLPQIGIAAITNDTVATLATLAYTLRPAPSRRVVLGLIVGTGTNASLLMELSTLHQSKRDSIKLPAKIDKDHTRIVLNTEWSLWGTIGPVREAGLITKWDEQLDRESDDPGFMPFEYMCGGRYLGEIVRLIVNDFFCIHQNANEKSLPEELRKRYALPTDYLSEVFVADMPNEERFARVEQDLKTGGGDWQWTTEKAEIMRKATRAVRRRSAGLVAAAVVGGLICAGDFVAQADDSKNAQHKIHNQPNQELIVAFTGGVISSFPHYLEECQEAVDKITQSLSHPQMQQQVLLREVLDGGVIGAGVLAGTVWNLPQQQRGTT